VKIWDELGNHLGTGHSYIVFQLEHRDHLPTALRLTQTSGNEMFNPATKPKVEPKPRPGPDGLSPAPEPLPAVQSLGASCRIGLTDAAFEDREVLEVQFKMLIKTLARYHKAGASEAVSNCLTAATDGRPLYFKKEVFGSAPVLRTILRQIGARYAADVTISMDMELSRRTGELYLNEIRWVFA
jgi:hypothetical protein